MGLDSVYITISCRYWESQLVSLNLGFLSYEKWVVMIPTFITRIVRIKSDSISKIARLSFDILEACYYYARLLLLADK